MNAAVDFPTANSSIDNDRIGVTGFRMGGRIAWLMAATSRCCLPVPITSGKTSYWSWQSELLKPLSMVA